MDPLISGQLGVIRRLCERHGVRRARLFGSCAGGGIADARRDVDLLVEFEESPPGGPAAACFDIKEALEAVPARRVDLVTVGAVRNPYFARSVERTRVPIYAAT